MSDQTKVLQNHQKIIFIGSGAIATALGNILAADEDISVCLLSIEPEVVKGINENQINAKYFPSFRLHPHLKATDDKTILENAHIIFLALPSVAVVEYIENHRNYIPKDALIVNLAKGFGQESALIPDTIEKLIPNKMAVMKGPSFAREIINHQPTAFTIASTDTACFDVFRELFSDTSIYLDFTTDVKGVEYASILKNIYAILIGIVDANFDSPNLRSLVLSKSINEMRRLISYFGGQDQTIFNYCGFGDFSLTALNDLSRNRTLGLLIGKGFFTQGISEKVVLEGRIAVNVFYNLLANCCKPEINYPLITELYKVFNEEYDIKKFVGRILQE